jgi:DNA repair protein RadA/Sms
MAKLKKRYVCQACGAVSNRWTGQCADCAEWNSLVEDADGVVTPFSARHNLRTGGRRVDLVGLDAEIALPARISTGIAELDRALGGGLVAGSATLIGGDPGIGKSTLLLQTAAKIAARDFRSPIFPARRRPTRSGCARAGSGSARRRCGSPRRPRCATS